MRKALAVKEVGPEFRTQNRNKATHLSRERVK